MATSHWFVGGGAEHSAEMVRRELFASQGGAEGIAEPTDLMVRPLAIPGGGVRVSIGSGFMKARNAGATNEMYMGSVVTEEEVTIPPNNGSSMRRDLIVMRVHDPFWQGSPWPDPGADIVDPEEAAEARANAQYIFIDRIPSVPAGTTRLQDVTGYENDTAITLARLDIPGTTGTITGTMITDLRELARPHEKTVQRAFGLTAADDGEEQLDNRTAYPAGETWPDAAVAEANFRIEIPSWATQAVILMLINGVKIPATTGNAYGRHWVQIGANTDPDVVRTEPTRWDVLSAGGAYRTVFSTADTVNIPAGMRGTTKRFYPRGNVELGATLSCPIADWATSVYMMVTFREVKE